MGQKVSPIGMRLGIVRDWDSKWYANKLEVPELLHEDLKIRKEIDNRAVKKTLSIPQWLNTMAEERNINFSQILQKALKAELNI